ncbi:MAG: glycosyltransferase [Emcibacteraceae bacterium]|nr:glycosyltransferase [Emcibacteraceae bacterium]
MKILIVAGTFPPYAPSSASRANKFAKYLEQQGHDVKVLAPKLPGQDMSLTPEISLDKIILTDFYDVNDFPTDVINYFKNLFSFNNGHSVNIEPDKEPIAINSNSQYKESTISKTYRFLTNVPDRMIGWYPSAIRAGRKLFQEWSPDVIFSTAPPYTSFVVAHRLAKMIDIPWVADYRDLWIDASNYQYKTMRGRINKIVEKILLSNCNGLITVTDTWVQNLQKRYEIPVALAMNGFDPDDFDEKNKNVLYPDHLTFLYAGVLYGRRRDPSLLFEALGKLGEQAKEIKVLFYTPNGGDDFSPHQKALIDKYNLHDQIIANKFIPQKELLDIQLGVDILLLLRWDDPAERGVIAGKLFEYIGAKKTILSVGSVEGEAADIIRDNDFGTVSNDVDEIVKILQQHLKNKKDGIEINSENKNRNNYTRSLQFEKIEQMLIDLANKKQGGE